MNKAISLILIVLLTILVGGETFYIYVQQGQISDLQYSLTTKDSEISRLKAMPSLEGSNITIGVIAPTTNDLVKVKVLMSLAKEDINSYLSGLNRNFTFNFLTEDAESWWETHQEKMQNFKAAGIDLVIGGFWSSQADVSGKYATENEMLLISPGSTSPSLAVPGDNLFRLSDNELKQGPINAEMLWSFGIKAIIVIQRDDPWGDLIFNATAKAFELKGGVVVDRIIYGLDAMDFSGYLQEAEAKSQDAIKQYGKVHLAIDLFAFQEAGNIAKLAKDYPTIYDLLWFGTDATSPSALSNPGGMPDGNIPIGEALEEASHLKIFSPYPAPIYSEKYQSLNERFRDLVNRTLDFYEANWYDAAWIYAKAVLATETTNATIIKGIIPKISGEYFGVTGLCSLDANGDRSGIDYDIWGIDSRSGKLEFIRYGRYNGMTGEVTWFSDELGFVPLGP